MKFTDEQMAQLQQIMDAGLAPVNLALKNGEKRMDGLDRRIVEFSLKQEANNLRTEQMWESFDAVKKGLKVLEWLGMVVVRGWPVWVAIGGWLGWGKWWGPKP